MGGLSQLQGKENIFPLLQANKMNDSEILSKEYFLKKYYQLPSLLSEEEFHNFLLEAIEYFNKDISKLSYGIGSSKSTIKKWISKESCPMPRRRISILRNITNCIIRQ